jgi:hypothetical protein
MTPTSIVVAGSGSSASIRADGGVDFAAATSLSLNGVFTSACDNYVLTIRGTWSSSGSTGLQCRLRLSGTDASALNYTFQYILAGGTSVSAARESNVAQTRIGHLEGAILPNGDTCFIYGPNLVQPTAFRSVNVSRNSSARIIDYASTHSLSTSYDGFTIFPDGGSITGMITVYGYTQ